jgi:hypothetical protein
MKFFKWIASRLDICNVVKLWRIAKQFALEELRFACRQFIGMNRDEVVGLEQMRGSDDLAAILVFQKEQVKTYFFD